MAFTPGPQEIEFNNWYDTKFKPAMERGPLDKYVARQAWFAATNPLLARIAALEAQVEQSEKVAYCHARDVKEPTLKEAQVEQTAQPFADPFTYVIQHLNSNPYALTKDECIEKIKELRALYTSPPNEPAQLQKLSEFEEGTLVIEHMGPSALAGGRMSLMDAFDKGLKVGQSELAAKNGVELK